MSRTATKPSPLRTWSPSRTSPQKRQSGCDTDDSLSGHRATARSNERTDRRVEEPWRVVVPVAAAGSIDEHEIRPTDLRAPVTPTGCCGRASQPCAPSLLLGG